MKVTKTRKVGLMIYMSGGERINTHMEPQNLFISQEFGGLCIVC